MKKVLIGIVIGVVLLVVAAGILGAVTQKKTPNTGATSQQHSSLSWRDGYADGKTFANTDSRNNQNPYGSSLAEALQQSAFIDCSPNDRSMGGNIPPGDNERQFHAGCMAGYIAQGKLLWTMHPGAASGSS